MTTLPPADREAARPAEGVGPVAGLGVMAAEWLPHARCFMAWPCRRELWQAHLSAARRAYAELAKVIASYEPVTMIAREADVADASIMCGARVEVLPLPIDDSWVRDTGPTFVVGPSGEVAGVAWRSNGWGGRYEPVADDAALAERLLERLGLPAHRSSLVIEGGALATDGEGTLIATEQCVLDPARNPGLSRDVAEARLREALGARAVVWLRGGLAEDETNGHVDNVARFAAPGVVLAAAPGDEDDPNHAVLRENLDRLAAAHDAAGRPFRVIEVPRPAAAHLDGRALTRSYLNFYLANDAVIVPVYDDRADDEAVDMIAAAFRKRAIETVAGTDIAVGGGGFHCVALEQPAAAAS